MKTALLFTNHISPSRVSEKLMWSKLWTCGSPQRVQSLEAGSVIVQMHSFPTPFPVHEAMVAGRGAHVMATSSKGNDGSGTAAESKQPLPSLKRNSSVSPGVPVWHCFPPSLTMGPLVISLASENPSAGVHVASSFWHTWLMVSFINFTQPSALSKSVTQTVHSQAPSGQIPGVGPSVNSHCKQPICLVQEDNGPGLLPGMGGAGVTMTVVDVAPVPVESTEPEKLSSSFSSSFSSACTKL
mmetsp:Transcript_47948/g.88235  ORF Transcript_47948/g.88235 Transcript_47948/m.88235 type:complete len:241 (-) Transcript_47948:242-964(-)